MAVPLVEAQTRYQVGLIEDAMRTWLSDRTHWSRMLKGNTYPEAFDQEQASVLARLPALLTELLSPEQASQCRVLEDAKPMTLAYPTEQLPEKVVSRSFDKTPVIEGRLLGVKGQYWILDNGVLNIRKHTAYDVVLEEVG